MAAQLEVLTVPDAAALRSWLAARPAADAGLTDGVWLTLAKKGTTSPTSLSYAQAVDEALCFGWIDGQTRSVDDATYQLRFTPRRARSAWSKRNVDHVTRLLEEGRMTPRGMAEIERAKADGRWENAYAGPATIAVPADLAAALEQEPAASAAFDALRSQERYQILYRLHHIKTASIRMKRLEEYVGKLARGEAL